MKTIEGFELEGPWKYHSTIRFHCDYFYKGHKNHICVEYALKRSIKTIESVEMGTILSPIYGTTIAGIKCYGFDDLLARKMLALHDRCEGRDMWDCYYGIPLAKNLKNAISTALKQFLKETIEHIQRINIHQKRELTNPYIPQQLRPDWVELRNTLVMRIERLAEE